MRKEEHSCGQGGGGRRVGVVVLPRESRRRDIVCRLQAIQSWSLTSQERPHCLALPLPSHTPRQASTPCHSLFRGNALANNASK